MSAGHTPTILIVEDDPDVRTFYRTALIVAGYAVVAVEDGLDALRWTETDRPDLIILDIALPRVCGLDVQQELASHAETRNIPILVVTGTDTGGLDLSQAACVLNKPVSADALLTAVDVCLRRSNASRRERRARLRCLICGSDTITQETTVRGGAVTLAWKCSACDSVWPERRRAS